MGAEKLSSILGRESTGAACRMGSTSKRAVKAAGRTQWPSACAGKARIAKRAVHVTTRQSDIRANRIISAASQTWANRLTFLSSKLKSLSDGWEDSFHQLIMELQDIQAGTEKLTWLSERVTIALHGKEIEDAINSLDWILEMQADWLKTTSADRKLSPGPNAEKIVEKTSACLDSLRQRHRMSAAAAKDFCIKSENASREICAIIDSMAFYDLIRNLLAQTIKEIENLAAGFDRTQAGSSKTRRMVRRGPSASMREVCARQADALLKMKREFDSAIRTMISSICLASTNLSGIPRYVFLADNGGEGRSYLSDMGSRLSLLADGLKRFPGEAENNRSADAGNEPPQSGHTNGPDTVSHFVDMLNCIVESLNKTNDNIIQNLSLIDEAGRNLSKEVATMLVRLNIRENMPLAALEFSRGIAEVADEFLYITAPKQFWRIA